MTTIVERIEVEEDRVIMRGGIGSSILLDVGMDDDPGMDKFNELFERVKGPGKSDNFLANPDEDWYQGIAVMAVIKRKSDGRLFGYEYWTPIAKYGDAHYEANGGDHGFLSPWDDAYTPVGFEGEEPVAKHADGDEDDPTYVWVWLPVEPFTVTGYCFPAAADSKDDD